LFSTTLSCKQLSSHSFFLGKKKSHAIHTQ
jgi:hypothetical protein